MHKIFAKNIKFPSSNFLLLAINFRTSLNNNNKIVNFPSCIFSKISNLIKIHLSFMIMQVRVDSQMLTMDIYYINKMRQTMPISSNLIPNSNKHHLSITNKAIIICIRIYWGKIKGLNTLLKVQLNNRMLIVE